jgi:hypothetical protein
MIDKYNTVSYIYLKDINSIFYNYFFTYLLIHSVNTEFYSWIEDYTYYQIKS